MQFRLLTPPTGNPKLSKSSQGYYPTILHLAPAGVAGLQNVCLYSSPDCRAICLYYAGRGGILESGCNLNNIMRVRIARTRSFLLDKDYFLRELDLDIITGKSIAKKKGLKFCCRLNGTSDIAFENYSFTDYWGNHQHSIVHKHKDVQFYDHTKNYNRISENFIHNLYLLYSYSGYNEHLCKKLLTKGINVAVVFKDKLPETFWGYPVFDGDESDLRFLDPQEHIIGLKAKGYAKKIKTKMVID